MKTIDRERTVLLALWAMLIAVFGWWPELDLWVSQAFYTPGEGFTARQWGWLMAFDRAVPWVGRALLIATLIAIAWSWYTGNRSMAPRRHLWRRSAALALTLTLGLGAVVHGVFKENWGRSRPDAVQAFGGNERYTGPLEPTGNCQRNCSFVSGHAATGFSLISVGILGAHKRRRRWLIAGSACGLLIGLDRMLLGKHFLSDILFGLAILWTCAMVLRWVWLGLTRKRQMRRVHASMRQLTSP